MGGAQESPCSVQDAPGLESEERICSVQPKVCDLKV